MRTIMWVLLSFFVGTAFGVTWDSLISKVFVRLSSLSSPTDPGQEGVVYTEAEQLREERDRAALIALGDEPTTALLQKPWMRAMRLKKARETAQKLVSLSKVITVRIIPTSDTQEWVIHLMTPTLGHSTSLWTQGESGLHKALPVRAITAY